MDVVSEVITASCPLAFGGASGSVFLNAITALIAAHCTIFADYRWPADKADAIIEKEETLSYDFIIVGAGTAGSLIASSLSNIYRHSSILLVEAGEDPGIDSEVPAFLFLNQQSNNDWNYKTEADKNSCLSFKNKSCIWSKGKGMGGSNSINAMLYIRGHAEDFNDWEQLGNPGWGYDNLKYYFGLQEERFNISRLARTKHDGWYAIIDDAWQQIRLKSLKYEDNNEAVVGTKKCKLLTKDGKRLNTAKIVLNNATNLDVMKDTMVENIILNKELQRAIGIQVFHARGRSLKILANKEVILSAGSIASPLILMRSGIGIKKHLEKIGLKCILDLPVGQNLQDHLILPLLFKTNETVALPHEMVNLFILEYMLMRSGPISNIGITDFFAFINTKNSSYRPNIQLHHMYFIKNNRNMLKQYFENIGYNKEIVDEIIALNIKHDILGIFPTLLHPKSRGEILLRDSNWKSTPIIKANYLQHPDDLQTLIEAIKIVHKLEQTEVFKSLDVMLLKLKISSCTPLTFNTDSYWRCYIRHMATTIYHPVGTVKMGNDSSSVVDYNLLVHGINNLRVVDASIMPNIPGANTMASTLAIAHKAVDIVTNKHSEYYKDEL